MLDVSKESVVRMTDKEIIIQLYRDENIAMVQKNLSRLNEILAPTMKLTHMTGYVQSKLEWIDQIQNEEMQYFASKEDTIKAIQIEGNRASLIGQNQVQARIWGGVRILGGCRCRCFMRRRMVIGSLVRRKPVPTKATSD